MLNLSARVRTKLERRCAVSYHVCRGACSNDRACRLSGPCGACVPGLFIYERVAVGSAHGRPVPSLVCARVESRYRRVGWRSAGHLVYNRTLVY